MEPKEVTPKKSGISGAFSSLDLGKQQKRTSSR